MSIENRVEATAKNIEGKVQEMIGEVTGNPQDKAEGQAKQAEAQLRHTVENIKDDVKKSLEQYQYTKARFRALATEDVLKVLFHSLVGNYNSFTHNQSLQN